MESRRSSATPRRQISSERKLAYYGGIALTAIGLILFVSNVFVLGKVSGPGEFFALPLAGMALCVVGGILTSVGRSGLAGAGVVLDPEQARRDVEPLSRMTGGMVKDALDEAGIDLARNPQVHVKVKCRACGALNDEHDKFCGQCGKAM